MKGVYLPACETLCKFVCIFFLIYVRKIKHRRCLKQIVNKKPLMHRKKIN